MDFGGNQDFCGFYKILETSLRDIVDMKYDQR